MAGVGRLGSRLRPAIRVAYGVKRRYGIGDRFFAHHPKVVDAAIWLLRPFKDQSVVDVHGHFLRVDPNDYLGLTITREYEPGVTRYLTRSVLPGQTALDLGAHVGYFTLLLARLVGPAGRVVSFEPDPDNFLLLEQNVRTNGYRNVSLEMSAVSDRSLRGTLFLSELNSGDHRLFGEADRSGIEVDVVALDDRLADLQGVVRWIKMDIQGAELHAVRGMRTLFDSCPQLTVVTEFMPTALLEAGSLPEALFTFFDGLGFRAYQLGYEGDLHTTSVDEALSRTADGTYLNLVFDRST
jgi:FkbM family methyltransferase